MCLGGGRPGATGPIGSDLEKLAAGTYITRTEEEGVSCVRDARAVRGAGGARTESEERLHRSLLRSMRTKWCCSAMDCMKHRQAKGVSAAMGGSGAAARLSRGRPWCAGAGVTGMRGAGGVQVEDD